MSFLNPIFLIALISVAVPLLIYLLNLKKPKRVAFSTLSFFSAIQQSSLRKIKLKRRLLLFLRMAAVASLAIALARPQFQGAGQSGSEGATVVGVLIDNSPSMEQVDQNGPWMDQAVKLVAELADAYDENTRFLPEVTNGESLYQPMMSGASLKQAVAQLTPRNAGNDAINKLLSVLKQLQQAPEPNKRLVILTDGQRSQWKWLQDNSIVASSEAPGSSSASIHDALRSAFGGEPLPALDWIRVGRDGTNRNSAVREVMLKRENQGYVLDIALVNYGEQRAQNQLLSLYRENELLLQQAFELEAQSETWVRFPVPEPVTDAVSGTRLVVNLELRIEGDEITFDDRTYWTIEFPMKRRILLVNHEEASKSSLNSYLETVLRAGAEADQLYDVITVSSSMLTADRFTGVDAVVLNGVPDLPDYLIQPLTDHLQQGAGLLLLPSAQGNLQGYNRLIGTTAGTGYQGVLGSYGSFQAVERLASPTEGHPILDGIFDKEESEPIQLDPPSIYFYYNISTDRDRSSIPILKTRSGKTLLAETTIGDGSLIYSAIGADPGWSDFPLKPFFAPLFHKTVRYLSAGEGANINRHELGTPFQAEIADGSPSDTELIYKEQVIRPELQQTFTGVNVRYEGLEWNPGFGLIRSGEKERIFSINQNAMESDLSSLSSSETGELLESHFETFQYASSEDLLESDTGVSNLASFGRDFWYWFILLGIGFLLAESLVSRYYKAESAGSTSRPSDN